MEKFNFSLDRKVVAIFILVVGTYFAFTHDVKTAQATTNPSGLTGQFGCLLNRNSLGYQTNWQNSPNNVGVGVIFYLDYATNTGKAQLTLVDSFNGNTPTTKTEKISTTFTETAVDGVTSVYKLVHAVTNSDGSDGGTAQFIGIVVNSGNTILMSQVQNGVTKAPYSGVCQKV